MLLPKQKQIDTTIINKVYLVAVSAKCQRDFIHALVCAATFSANFSYNGVNPFSFNVF